MNEIKRQKHSESEVAQRHIPQMVVPVPFDDIRDFVKQAVKGTSRTDPAAQLLSGFVLFEPHLRYSVVDATHTRIEIDVAQRVHGADVFLYTRRIGLIDRFFVAIQDELDGRQRRPFRGPAAAEGSVTE